MNATVLFYASVVEFAPDSLPSVSLADAVLLCCCVFASDTLLFAVGVVQANKLASIINEKDSALENMKMAEREFKRSERNTAALIAASASPDSLSLLNDRIVAMEKEISVNDARVTEARSQMAAVREEHEKLAAALFAARGDAEVAKVSFLSL